MGFFDSSYSFFDFSQLFVSMRDAGVALAQFFANFGSGYTKPFFEGWLQAANPLLYSFFAPFFSASKDLLYTFFDPELVDWVLGFTLFDYILIGTVVVVLINFVRKLLDLLPFA